MRLRKVGGITVAELYEFTNLVLKAQPFEEDSPNPNHHVHLQHVIQPRGSTAVNPAEPSFQKLKNQYLGEAVHLRLPMWGAGAL